MSLKEEFPLEDEIPPQETAPPNTPESSENPPDARPVHLSQTARNLLRFGMQAAAVLAVVAAGWAVRRFIVEQDAAEVRPQLQAALAAPAEEAAVEPVQQAADTTVSLPLFTPAGVFNLGIPRFAVLHTTIPTRPRVDVITYTVQAGDTVFGIADFYGLRPETIFWGNQDVLNDDPHKLFPGQVLNILPVDGVYHKWSAGENLDRVADFYGVDAAAILEYPGNHIEVDPGEGTAAGFAAGTWLIVPGGEREFVDFGPPRITRSNPAAASTYGPGHCGSIYDGAVGTGSFIWPTTETYLSGYDYNPAANHSGIDIAGDTGNPIYASDAGVVVYAGWSYFGYGNLVVIDHGDWQTLYAHLSDFYVVCGQSVFQGTVIAAMGSTGNSSGPHLHFEIMYLSAKVNPWDYVSP